MAAIWSPFESKRAFSTGVAIVKTKAWTNECTCVRIEVWSSYTLWRSPSNITLFEKIPVHFFRIDVQFKVLFAGALMQQGWLAPTPVRCLRCEKRCLPAHEILLCTR
ncbi:hypothetical protein XU18_0766 [Perkinsela sp. CCAP 1560/4]|nr:hypothetical protein XU18_0766 [Perkinsela sp. CCAP 1560/4]|eukprot:KNH08772.1 hypothetical protein XU18_0766 [Perkinsela sp. CCAP 1560/4]